MSYNDIASAKAFTGVTFVQEQLDAAQSLIHAYTDYRWKDTTDIRRFTREYDMVSPQRGAGSGTHFGNILLNSIMYLNYPITTFTYLKEIDEEDSSETTLTRFDDYDYDKETGQLEIYSGSSSSTVFNNFEVSYIYGYTAASEYFAIVRYAEAQLALMMMKNPLLLNSQGLTGDTFNYGTSPIDNILKNIPKPVRFIALGGTPLETLR